MGLDRGLIHYTEGKNKTNIVIIEIIERMATACPSLRPFSQVSSLTGESIFAGVSLSTARSTRVANAIRDRMPRSALSTHVGTTAVAEKFKKAGRRRSQAAYTDTRGGLLRRFHHALCHGLPAGRHGYR